MFSPSRRWLRRIRPTRLRVSLLGLLLVAAFGLVYIRYWVPLARGRPTVRTVDLATTVTLANGTTLSVVRGPEAVETTTAGTPGHEVTIRLVGVPVRF